MTDQAADQAALDKKRHGLRMSKRRLHGPAGAEREPDWSELERVASYCAANEIEADAYGDGEHLQAFEARVAAMLGYPAGRFMPSGTMVQPIAVRIWSDRAGVNLVGMHPTCHLELHEERGYSRLHNLHAAMVGEPARPMTAQDLANAPEPMSALIVELPTRENGGQLAPWDDLVELCDSARERGIATHLDGARLWEAAAGYDRPLTEICALFDSAYVSFYKGIGALPGSMLVGDTDFITEAALWQRRQGGNLFTSMANWLSADMRLDQQIAKMPTWRDRATVLAAALVEIDGVTINPSIPQVNMFHVLVAGDEEALLLARDHVADRHDLWLFGGLASTDVPGTYKFEFTVGDAASEVTLDEIVAAFTTLVGVDL